MAFRSHRKLKQDAWAVLCHQREKNERFAQACPTGSGVTYTPPLKHGVTTLDDIEHYFAQENSLRKVNIEHKRVLISAYENLSPEECAYTNMKYTMHTKTVAGMRQASKYGTRLKFYVERKFSV